MVSFLLLALPHAAVSALPGRPARALAADEATASGIAALGYYYQDHGRVADWYTLVVLPDLASGERLAGEHVVVRNGAGPDAAGARRRFLFPPEDPRFSEVNAYVQASLALGLFRDLGFGGFGAPCTVVVNSPCGAVPSSASERTLRLAGECAGSHRDAARFADVIHRGVALLVLERAGLRAAGETAALREGLADYFAASFLDSPHLRDWLLPACDGGPRSGAMTWLDSDPATVRYERRGAIAGCGVPAGDPAADGMIVGGALWDLRRSIGYVACDSLVFAALGHLDPGAGFAGLRDALVRADAETRRGRHAAAIAAAFDARGIRDERAVVITGPALASPSVSARYNAELTGSAWPAERVSWYRYEPCADGRCPEDVRRIGEGPTVSVADRSDFRLRAVITDAGGREVSAEKEIRVGYTPEGWILPLHPSDAPVRAKLPWLPSPGSPDWGTLYGRYVRVFDVRGPEARATNEYGDFLHPQDSPGFDQVNVYYHATRFLSEYLPAFGFDSLASPLPIHVNMGAPVPCAPCYVDGEVFLLNGPGGGYTLGNFARATDAIVHEVTHAVLSRYAIQSSVERTAEHAALHEGLADYFAAAYTGDTRMGEEVYPQRYLDGSPRCPDGDTRVDTDLTYASLNTARGCYSSAPDPHGNGQIVSGALWEVRGALGDTLNTLVIDALKILRSRTTTAPLLACFTDAVRAADRGRFDGRHEEYLVSVFHRRGLTIPNRPRLTAPATRPPGERVTYGLTSPCGLPTEATWSTNDYDCERREPIGGWVPLGSGPSTTLSSFDDFMLRAEWPDGSGGTAVDSLALTVGEMPFITIDPRLETVRRGVPTTYRAVVTRGYGPISFVWEYSSMGPGGFEPWTVISTEPHATVVGGSLNTTYFLRVRATDAQCMWNRATLAVLVTAFRPGEDGGAAAAEPAVLSLIGTRPGYIGVAGGTPNEEAEVFDVAGRAVGRARGGGTRWIGPLDGGVYFCRLRTAAGIENRKVLVLR